MAEFTDHITPDHAAMIARQSVFFVATAAAEGRINLSPKGLDGTFRVLSPHRAAWLDRRRIGQRDKCPPARDGR